MKAILVIGTKMLGLKGKPEVDRRELLSNDSLEWLRTEVDRVFVAYSWSWETGNKHFESVKDLQEVRVSVRQYLAELGHRKWESRPWRNAGRKIW